MQTQVLVKELFAIGDMVSISGYYVCVPCGYIQYFEAGTVFLTCDACLAGTEYGPEGFTESGAEFWSLIA